MTKFTHKSSIEEIRQRFDQDVERFSNLQTGQVSTIDAPLTLELIVQAAAAATPKAKDILDVGCGAGNYTLRMLTRLPDLNVTLVDLSQPMLDRALIRTRSQTRGNITPWQGDVRKAPFAAASFDIIVAAAVLHHLRDDGDWEAMFARFYEMLRPGGSLWISDLVCHDHPDIQKMMWQRYGQYLTSVKDETYRDAVFAYIEKEDSPRSLTYQIELLKKSGFSHTEILHKNSCFATFGAIK